MTFFREFQINDGYLGSAECRMDYALPCPDRLRRVLAAPQLLYSACWESTDITSLILKGLN